MLWSGMRPNCTTVVLDRAPSPDGMWVAVNEKFVCKVVESDIEGEVHLVMTKLPFREIPLLLIGYGSYANQQRPHIAWSVPGVLRVTAPLHSLLHVLKKQTDGVRLDLHFDPDDPAARAAWLKQPGQPPEADNAQR